MDQNNNTKLFWAIIIGAVIIGLAIYFGFDMLTEEIAAKYFGP